MHSAGPHLFFFLWAMALTGAIRAQRPVSRSGRRGGGKNPRSLYPSPASLIRLNRKTAGQRGIFFEKWPRSLRSSREAAGKQCPRVARPCLLADSSFTEAV